MFMALRHKFIWQLRHTYTLFAILGRKTGNQKDKPAQRQAAFLAARN